MPAPLSARQSGASRSNLKSLLSTLQKERLIGNGADGKVFLMRDPEGHPYAVKEMILSDHQLARAEDVKKHIEALQRLPSHEHVINHHGAHLGTCTMHIVMEFVPGGSISALLSNLGAFGEAAVRRYARQLCEGLAFLHKQDVVHRDIKGANCLVNNDGRLQIADFGSSAVGDAGRTTTGLQGTAHWMSPESIREEVSTKGDIWALGCTVIEMATARSPWADARFTNDWAAMFHISQCGRGPPIPPHLSRQAHAFLRSCFEINPESRPTAEDCLQLPFLTQPFDPESDDPEMRPPDESEITPMPDMPRRDDSPMAGTDYASTFSSVSFAPIDPEWGDAEQPALEADMTPNPSGAVSDTTGGNNFDRASGLPIAVPESESDTVATSERPGSGSATAPAAAGARRSISAMTPSLPPRAPNGFATSEDILTCVRQVATDGGGATPATSSAAQSLAPMSVTAASLSRSVNRLEEGELFNVLTYLPVETLGVMAAVSKRLHGLIDEDSKERLWRKLFVAVFGPVDDVRSSLRKSWKVAFRMSKRACTWTASNGRYRVKRCVAHSPAVFEAVDLQGGALGTGEPMPCIVKVEALPRPKTRAASTPVKKGRPDALAQTPGRSHTASRHGLPPTSPSRLPPQLPTLSHPPAVPTPGSGDDPKSRLPPTQGGRFTFIRPPQAGGTLHGVTGVSATSSAPSSSPSGAALNVPSSRLGSRHGRGGASSSSHGRGTAAAAAASAAADAPPAVAVLSTEPASPLTVDGGGTVVGNTSAPSGSAGGGSGATATSSSHAPAEGLETTPPRPPLPAAPHRPEAPVHGHPPRPPSHAGLGHRPPTGGGAPAAHHLHAVIGSSTALSSARTEASAASLSGPSATNPSSASATHPPSGGGAANAAGVANVAAVPSGGGSARDQAASQTLGTSSSTTLPTPLQFAALASQPPSSAAGGGGTTSRAEAWNDLYEYQRQEPAPIPTSKPTRSSAHHQYRILRHLDAMGVGCIPRPLYLNADGSDVAGHSMLVTSALGPSLSELLLFSGNQLSTRTVMTLALKLLMALADMHDRDVVHGAITPSNLVMGRDIDRDKVFFVNFSHSRFYRDPKTHRAATNVLGAAVGAKRSYEYYCFCSTSVQRGCTPCPRDDVISVGYVLCYLTHGGLPWSSDGTQLDGAKLVRAKNQYLDSLSSTPPLQLYHFLKSAYALKQTDSPDYVFLCNLIRRMMRDRGWSPDAPLDWHKRATF